VGYWRNYEAHLGPLLEALNGTEDGPPEGGGRRGETPPGH
jgi:hypothetical protein